MSTIPEEIEEDIDPAEVGNVGCLLPTAEPDEDVDVYGEEEE